jgi:hypothetical protein
VRFLLFWPIELNLAGTQERHPTGSQIGLSKLERH